MGFACTAGESSATVKSNTTLEQDQAAAAKAGKPAPTPGTNANAYVAHELGQDVNLVAPDLTDNLLEQARKRMGMQLLARSDRRRSMSGGSYGTSAYSLLEDPRASRLNKPFR